MAMLQLLQALRPAAGIIWLGPIAILSYLIARSILRTLFLSPRNTPGPFLARFSRLWYLRQILKGDFEKTNIALHRRHGR